MCSPDIDHWRLIIPVKGQLTAKSRLHPPAGVARAGLAHAFALDTITAAAAGIPPERLVVVTADEPTATFVRDLGGIVVADQGEGLNPAISTGIEHVRRVLGPGPTAVLLGDIPTRQVRPRNDSIAKIRRFLAKRTSETLAASANHHHTPAVVAS